MGGQQGLRQLFQRLNLLLDAGGQPLLRGEPSVDGQCKPTSRHLPAQVGAQVGQRLYQCRAAGVEPCQSGTVVVVHLPSQTCGVLGPLPLPAVAVDPPSVDVIFHFRDLGGG